MIDTENMTFEEARLALVDDLKSSLENLRNRFADQQVDWGKLQDSLHKVVGDSVNIRNMQPDVVEVRPRELECDVVRFQNNKEKWVALVGLLIGHPFEIFTGLQDDE